MKLTILFDLDDTLLNNSMETFLPAYLQKLAVYLRDCYPPEKLPATILTGTEAMHRKPSPFRTLEDKFNAYFYPEIGHNKEKLETRIYDFYENVFPELENHTSIVPGMKELIVHLTKAGHDIIIATNPLFPRRAIEHRLNWAGLPVTEFPFKLVTSFEKFHFAKPDPAYIAEAVAQIGWPDNPIIFIGNDWELDIQPAETLGIPTFYLGPSHPEGVLRHELSANGTHDQIQSWIEKVSSNLNQFDCRYNPSAYLAILRSTPAALTTTLNQDIGPEMWDQRPAELEWSILEIINHLADVDAEVNIQRMQEIKQNEKPFFSAALTDEWAQSRNYQAREPLESFNRYLLSRQELIEEISSFTEEHWNKSVNHAIFGPTNVLELIKFIAQHDRIHVQQIHDTLQKVKAK